METDPPTILPITDNLRAVVRNADDNPRAVIIRNNMEARLHRFRKAQGRTIA